MHYYRTLKENFTLCFVLHMGPRKLWQCLWRRLLEFSVPFERDPQCSVLLWTKSLWLSRVKRLTAIYTGPFSTPVKASTQTNLEVNEISNQLTSKVQILLEQATLPEDKLTDMLESLNQLSTSSSITHPPTEPSLLFDAINELSDCESWKCNLIIYNLP